MHIIRNDKDLVFDDYSTIVNKIRYKKNKFPFVDIFFMVREIETGKAVYKCALEKHRNLWKNEFYLERELFPLKKPNLELCKFLSQMNIKDTLLLVLARIGIIRVE